MLSSPWVIRSYMVWDIIQNKADTPLGKLLAGKSQSFAPAKIRIHDVAAHAIRRPDHILRFEVRQHSLEFCPQSFIFHGNTDARRTALPDSHEPDGVNPKCRYGIPFPGGNISQIHSDLQSLAQFFHPHPGVDLINYRVFRPGFHD